LGAQIFFYKTKSSQEVAVKLGKRPVYSGAEMLGMDAQTIEAICRTGSAKLMDTVVKQLNPNLSHQLGKFRSSMDDFCEEAII